MSTGEKVLTFEHAFVIFDLRKYSRPKFGDPQLKENAQRVEHSVPYFTFPPRSHAPAWEREILPFHRTLSGAYSTYLMVIGDWWNGYRLPVASRQY